MKILMLRLRTVPLSRVASRVRRRPGLIILACATLVPGTVGCERTDTTTQSPASGDRPRLPTIASNILLISIDTLRADHLACYGHPAIKTPNIDRLAVEGTVFEQCVSAVPITLPSHTSMMTATYPFVHGVRDNAHFYVHPDNRTLAEALREAGYVTAAQIGAYVLNREFGLEQGFTTYDDIASTRRSTDARNERKAEEVCAGAIAWLRANASQRFFLFVHFFDPHRSYSPPRRFAVQYPHPYLGEVAYVDEQIGRLMGVLAELDLADRTLVILTSDHGEGLGEHDEDTHGFFVYDTTLRVPLILRYPGRIPAGRRIGAQARLIDIPPTVLDFLGLPALPDAQGTSLLSLIAGGSGGSKLPAYSETFYARLNMGYAWYRSWRQDGWKYIHAQVPELYHVNVDPDEKRNLASAEPDRVSRMRAALRNLLATSEAVAASAGARQQLSAGDHRALEALGYISSAAPNDEPVSELELFEPSGPDPKHHTAENRAMARAMELFFAGDHAPAERILRDILAQSDRQETFWWAHRSLADVLSAQGEHAEAIEFYKRALEIRPEDGETYSALGQALAAAERLDEALAAFERALRLPPVLADTHHEYGLALARQGRPHEALAQQRAAVARDPQYAEAHAEIGKLLARMGRTAEAQGAYEKAVALAPQNAQIRGRLAEFLLMQQRPAEALAQFQKLLEFAPDNARAYGGLGLAYSAAGQRDQAIESLEKAVKLDPRLGQAWRALGELYAAQQRYAEAITALEAGRKADPEDPALANVRAFLLATCPVDRLREGAEALRVAQDLARATARRDPNVLDTLAAALAEQGRFSEAVETIDEAISLARTLGDRGLAEQLKQRRALYAANRPFRLPTAP
jgi:arylsulfatase A-like enzyme/Tfp pilus assembly protein PilF